MITHLSSSKNSLESIHHHIYVKNIKDILFNRFNLLNNWHSNNFQKYVKNYLNCICINKIY